MNVICEMETVIISVPIMLVPMSVPVRMVTCWRMMGACVQVYIILMSPIIIAYFTSIH